MSTGKKIAFTICATNYLGKAKALLRSIDLHCGDYLSFLVIIDQIPHELESDTRILSINDIDVPQIKDMRSRYDVVEFSTSVKPFCFQHFFSKHSDVDQILYLDPDTFVFGDFKCIDDELAQADILLTPHLLKPVVDETTRAELRVAPSGVYNLGFIGLKRSENVDLFLTWWGKKLEKHSICDHKEGLFYDQNWVTYAPQYFDNVRVSQNPGLNIAVWNLGERTISKGIQGYLVNEAYPLTFFHFSQFRVEDVSGVGLPLAGWGLGKQNETLREVCQIYRKALVTENHARYEDLPYLRPGRITPRRIGFIFFGRIVRWVSKYFSPDFRSHVRRQIQGI